MTPAERFGGCRLSDGFFFEREVKYRLIQAENWEDVIRRNMEVSMATTLEYIEYVCEQIRGAGQVRYRKMFGEYMVYVNDKPILLVCDNTVYVKKLDDIKSRMLEAEVGCPYEGAKEHYILDIENMSLSREVAAILEAATPVPRSKKNKKTIF
jgi:TfoX/Sxy family transcriptional regulator of competence genes